MRKRAEESLRLYPPPSTSSNRVPLFELLDGRPSSLRTCLRRCRPRLRPRKRRHSWRHCRQVGEHSLRGCHGEPTIIIPPRAIAHRHCALSVYILSISPMFLCSRCSSSRSSRSSDGIPACSSPIRACRSGMNSWTLLHCNQVTDLRIQLPEGPRDTALPSVIHNLPRLPPLPGQADNLHQPRKLHSDAARICRLPVLGRGGRPKTRHPGAVRRGGRWRHPSRGWYNRGPQP